MSQSEERATRSSAYVATDALRRNDAGPAAPGDLFHGCPRGGAPPCGRCQGGRAAPRRVRPRRRWLHRLVDQRDHGGQHRPGLKLTERKSGLLSGDPAGYTISDVLYGGTAGHILGIGIVLGLRGVGAL